MPKFNPASKLSLPCVCRAAAIESAPILVTKGRGA